MPEYWREKADILSGFRLLRWKMACRLFRVGCIVGGRHRATLVWEPEWKEWYCPHCGWMPDGERR